MCQYIREDVYSCPYVVYCTLRTEGQRLDRPERLQALQASVEDLQSISLASYQSVLITFQKRSNSASLTPSELNNGDDAKDEQVELAVISKIYEQFTRYIVA